MPIPPHAASAAGIRFEPTDGKPGYISMNYHRGGSTAVLKNKWAVTPPEEYEIWARSHSGGWRCANDHNWSIKQDLAVLGQDEECIAKFPAASNEMDDRHGYPVSALDAKRFWAHRPPPELTTLWVQTQMISEFQKKRIDKGKV